MNRLLRAGHALGKAAAWARRFPEGGKRSVRLDLKLLRAVQASDALGAAKWARRGARPCNVEGVEGTNAWMEALDRSDVEMARILAEAGASWSGWSAKQGKMTPLMRACAAGDAPIAKILGALADEQEKNIDIAGETALSLAVRSGDLECVEAALSARALWGSDWFASPLTLAAGMGRPDLIERLVGFGKPGGDVAVQRWSGLAMKAAIEAGSLEALKALLNALPEGVDFGHLDASGHWAQRERALELAVKAGRSDMVELLGALSQNDHFGAWAWSLAIQAGDQACLEALARTRDQERAARGLGPLGQPWMPRLEHGDPAHEAARAAWPQAAVLAAERCDPGQRLAGSWRDQNRPPTAFELCWKDPAAPADRVGATAWALLMASPHEHLPALAKQAAMALNRGEAWARESSWRERMACDAAAQALAREAVLLWPEAIFEAAREADKNALSLWEACRNRFGFYVGRGSLLSQLHELDQAAPAPKRLEDELIQTLRASVSPEGSMASTQGLGKEVGAQEAPRELKARALPRL
jgi:ankyrin repeat protein